MTAKNERNDLLCVTEEPVIEEPPLPLPQPQPQPQQQLDANSCGESVSHRSNFSSRKSSLRRQECVVDLEDDDDGNETMKGLDVSYNNADSPIRQQLGNDMIGTQSDRSSGFYDVDVMKMNDHYSLAECAPPSYNETSTCSTSNGIYVNAISDAAMRRPSPIPSTSLEV